MRLSHFSMLLVILALSACNPSSGGGSGDPPPTPDKTIKINIADAKSAMIVKSNAAAAAMDFGSMAVGDTTKLFKITEDGYFLEVSITDASGDSVVISESPAAYVANVGTDYTVVYFVSDFSTYGSLDLALSNASDVYLVKNDTGDATEITEHGSPLYPPLYYEDSSIFREANSLFYYISEVGEGSTRRQVVKLDPATLNLTVITPSTDHVIYFDVDDSGNVIYSGYLWSDISSKSKRVITADDASHDIPWVGNTVLTFWKAPNGKLYYYDYADSHIKVVNVDASYNVSFDVYMNDPGFDAGLASNSYLLKTSSRVLISSTTVPDVDGDFECLDVYNADASPDTFKLRDIGITSITTAVTDTDSFYFSGPDASGDDIVVKVSEGGAAAAALKGPASFSAQAASFGGSTTILTSDYKVLKMVPNGTGGIIFSGIREADSQNVVGEIDSLGNDTIYQSGSQAETEALVKLN